MQFASWAVYLAFLEEHVKGVDFIILDIKVGSIFHKTKKRIPKFRNFGLQLTLVFQGSSVL